MNNVCWTTIFDSFNVRLNLYMSISVFFILIPYLLLEGWRRCWSCKWCGKHDDAEVLGFCPCSGATIRGVWYTKVLCMFFSCLVFFFVFVFLLTSMFNASENCLSAVKCLHWWHRSAQKMGNIYTHLLVLETHLLSSLKTERDDYIDLTVVSQILRAVFISEFELWFFFFIYLFSKYKMWLQCMTIFWL